MFENRVSLFKILGFQVWMDSSWLVLALLITWTLASGYFPSEIEGLSKNTYWLMGAVGAIGIFGSIVFHELWHSLVARRYGLPMKGITLFIFGGVAEMTDEPPSARAEFMMALAGPASSIFLSIGFFGLHNLLEKTSLPAPVLAVMFYLSFINGLLAAFNLLPGFPLDGGRLLRSVLWAWKDNFRWATGIASRIGSAFGISLILLGLFTFIAGNIIGGLWYFLIGSFLRNAARTSLQQAIMKQYLQGEAVKIFMNPDIITVAPSISVNELVENYIYRHHFKMFPVIEDKKLVGCVATAQIKDIPRKEWSERTVGDIAESCSSENTIGPDADAMDALSAMNRTGRSRLIVVDGDRLLGLISLRDLLQFLSLKLDLEGDNN
jgi:Zn-dependent protease